jgi:hypothetical protein
VLGKWLIKEHRYGKNFNAVMFRRTTVSSEDAIERAKELYLPAGAKYVGSPIPKFRMPNGGRITFAYLDTVEDADEYQGRNLTDVWVEEAGQFVTPAPILRLFGVLRSSHGVPVQLVLTANPGGAGQHWIAQRYGLIPFPSGPKVIRLPLANGREHRIAVIPSRITDNPMLGEEYIDNLHLVGSPQLVKAWLSGDWTAIEGAFFPEWSEAKHVLEPFPVPTDWLRFRSADWGSASPFSVGWWAVVGDEHRVHGRRLPRGALLRYREWYGSSDPNVGLKLTADEVAEGIKSREEGETITYGVLDPNAFAEDGGPSHAERMGARGVHFRRADNKRVPKAGAMGGWDVMRQRLKGQDGEPMIYCFSTCRDSIRTIPVLQHDQSRAEDLDTDMEDHAADEWRYACMSRPWVPAAAPEKRPRKTQVDWFAEPEHEELDWKTA